ncbi:MAG: terminase small subunit [Pseudomonas sp.]|nr:terminase small subunit [Pseudomonas sp.]
MRVTKAQLCEIVCRDERTISRWQNSGMPVLEVGLGRGNENEYETGAVIEWMVQIAQQRGEKESARERLDRIKADREELAFAKELGEVVIAEEFIQGFEAMVTAAKVEFLSTLPDNLASELSARYGVEIDEQLIREPIEAILRKMSEYDPGEFSPADDDPDGPGDAPEADDDFY